MKKAIFSEKQNLYLLDFVHVAEGIDAQDTDIARHEQQKLDKAGNHMPRFTVQDCGHQIDRPTADQRQDQHMIPCRLEYCNNGWERVPVGVWQKFGRVDEGQVSCREENKGLYAGKEDEAQDEQV